MGTALSNFNDFMNLTGPRYLTSAEQVVNEAVENTYLLSRLLRGKGMDTVIQGGSTIRDTLMLDDANTYDHYQPNETFTWTNPDVATNLEIDWRFSIDHLAWTDAEVELQVGDGLSRDAQKVVYKRLKRLKEQRLWTSMMNGMENDLFRLPADSGANDMESSTGKVPYSIPAFIHEDNSGGAHFNFSADTLQGLDISEAGSRYHNQVSTYDFADPDDSDGDQDGLLDSFDEMFLKVQFIPPAMKQEYYENPTLARQFIACSRAGINLYKKMLRDANDTLVNRQDPAYNNPQYSGIDLMYVSKLDTAAIYNDGSSNGVVESSADNAGPRYYWINGTYLTPVYHSRRYFFKHEVMKHPNQPFTCIQPVDCWWNMFCASRQRQGIVAPA
tara:strand:+ start:175 stop:1332 length:1158 start_codon:yes stop_codon:yes gene_type:complete